ncbi:MAG: hypothetical protein ACEPOZ_00540 [Marinifilaceae bacterium]
MKKNIFRSLSVVLVITLVMINLNAVFAVYTEDREPPIDGSGGTGDSMTVTCYDDINNGGILYNSYLKRACNLDTRCAKVKCSNYNDPGKCTLSN